MPSEIESTVFPHLNTDLDRVREVLGPVQFRSRPDLTALTTEGPDTSRRLVRPTLTLLSYYLLSDPAAPADDRVVRAAAAVELLHLGSLYHDDVIDHAYQRRGRPNANAVWGSHMAVLGGNSVTFSGARMLAELGKREGIVAATAGEQMCEGMMIEAADRYVADRSEQAYLDAIGGKTAALLSLACQVGAMQAGRREDEEEALALFGRYFGLAYQLFDDILDLTSTAEEMGKPVNGDLPEGIYTLPVIRAAARDRDLARLLRRAMTREQAAHARDLVIASGAVEEAQAMADELMDQAESRLATLPTHPNTRRAMIAYARSVLDRRPPTPAILPQAAPPPEARSHAVEQKITQWVRSWMVDTGIVVSAAEFDRHHRWAGALWFPPELSAAPADQARVQTTYLTMMMSFVWDDLFEDPRLRDPETVTALRRGMVAMLRQDPETPWRPGALPTAWASLWPRLREGRSARWQGRFLDGIEDWFEAAEREAHHRINGYIPATTDYLSLRMSTSGLDVARACVEVYQNRELPSKLRNHPVVRRLEELLFLTIFVENDLVGLDQDEADRIPYNLVRAIRHETGCTRRDAIEQVQRQVAEHRAQLDELLRYLPALFRMVPGMSSRAKEFVSLYEMTSVALRGHLSGRYTQTSASVAPDLERLRREVYCPAVEPAATAR